MERSNTHPDATYDDCDEDKKVIGLCGAEVIFNNGIGTTLKIDDLGDPITDDDDDEWDDITSCVLTYKYLEHIISTEMQMAGGGSHAWSYVLEWVDTNAEPDVFIKRDIFKGKCQNKTLIVRTEGKCPSVVSSVKLVNKGEDLPEDDDDYTYHRFECMTSNKHYEEPKDDEEFNEECRICWNLMCEEGGLTELEYDEYEGRDEGYDSDGDWVCPGCREAAEDREEEEVDVINCSMCPERDAIADGWHCEAYSWYCPDCADSLVAAARAAASAKCNCIGRNGQKCCQNDFNCSICGVCLYWKGYEEGTTKCGCQWG